MAAAYALMAILMALFSQVDGFHSFDGIGNNIQNPLWGSTMYPLQRRQVDVAVGYGNGSELTGSSRRSPREISVKLFLPPNRHKVRNDRYATDMLTYVAQFFDHDIDKTGENTFGEKMFIRIPYADPYYDPKRNSNDTSPMYMSMLRSAHILDSSNTRQQINFITAYVDGSVVYGETSSRAYKLRSHRNGRLLAYDSDMLPYATSQMDVAMDSLPFKENPVLAAGDSRANVNPPMMVLQTLFMREHNRLAKKLSAANPTWDDEKIFYEARKINVGLMQAIFFYELLPMLGIQLDPYTGYKSNVDPSIDNFFATVSFRFGHSAVGDIIYRLDDNGNEIPQGHIPLFESFFYPSYALNAGIEPILRGLAWRHQMETDLYFSNAISNFLFGDPGNGGSDLIAKNIQRGRDHGIPDYNTCRERLNLPRKRSFNEITSDTYLAVKLKELYGTVDNIDAYIGGLAEDHVKGTSLGELFYTSLKEQFTRLRDGDRYYFENMANGFFKPEDLALIRGTGLRDIILRNTNIKNIPENIYFRMPGDVWPRPAA